VAPPRNQGPAAPVTRRPRGQSAHPSTSIEHAGRERCPWLVGVVSLAFVLLIAPFDWNSLRSLVERYASRTTDRAVSIGHLDVRMNLLSSTVVLANVRVGNPGWLGGQPMGCARRLSRCGNDLVADLHGFTQRAGGYETRIGFTGKWRGSAFEGKADTGSVRSLRRQSPAVADLGLLVGAKKGARQDAAPARANADRVLPDTPFTLEKLNSMDADIRLTAAKMTFPGQIPLVKFVTRARVKDGALALDQLDFRIAGGESAGKFVLDASREPLAGSLLADFKRVKLSQLFPALERPKEGEGSLGAQVRLSGRGNSVAALLGSSTGTVMAGMAGGRVSELAV
jgi:hypothetical protein